MVMIGAWVRRTRMRIVSAMSLSIPPPANDSRPCHAAHDKQELHLLRPLFSSFGTLRSSIMMSELPQCQCVPPQTGAGRGGASILSHPVVLTVAVISGCITSASMIINDYFDWASGARRASPSSSSSSRSPPPPPPPPSSPPPPPPSPSHSHSSHSSSSSPPSPSSLIVLFLLLLRSLSAPLLMRRRSEQNVLLLLLFRHCQ